MSRNRIPASLMTGALALTALIFLGGQAQAGKTALVTAAQQGPATATPPAPAMPPAPSPALPASPPSPQVQPETQAKPEEAPPKQLKTRGKFGAQTIRNQEQPKEPE